MKVSSDREAFLAAFAQAASATSPRSPLEVLRFVRLDAPGGDSPVTLTGTDGRRFVRTVIPGCAVSSPGSALLDAERFRVALENLSAPDVAMELKGNSVRLLAGRASTDYPTEDPRAFPDFPAVEGHAFSLDMDSSQLWLLTDRTASSVDEARSIHYAFGGTILDVSDDSVSFVGTDGVRMAIQSIPHPGPAHPIAASMPPAALKLACALFKDPCRVRLAFGGPNPDVPHRLHVIGEKGEVVGQLAEGRIPPWRRFADTLPEPVGVAVVEAAEFRRAVKVAATCNTSDSRGIFLVFDADGLTVRSSGPDRGSVRVPVDANYRGGPSHVEIFSNYALDAVARFSPGTEVSLQVRGPKAPLSFCNGSFRCIVNPLVPEAERPG